MNQSGKLLIADDESTFCLATAALLQRENYACLCARDGLEAQQLLDDQDFDLVIADIHMRGNDGLQLVQRLAQRSPPVPVILVTGYPSTQSAIDAVGLPVIAYLVKPIPFTELLPRVRAGVRHTTLSRTVQAGQTRLQESLRQLSDLEAGLQQKPGDPAAACNTYLTLTLHNAFAALIEVKHLCESLAAGAPPAALGQPPEVTSTSQLVSTLADTLATLEKVQASLQNDDIQTLRERLTNQP